LSFVTVYVIEWYNSAGQALGCEDYSFAPGEGRTRYATIGPPGRIHPPGYPHAARTVERLMVAIPSGWVLDDPDHPAWLVNPQSVRPERLEAAGVYLRAVRGSAGFSVTAPVVQAK
jgi:hypothetical protein